MKSNTVHSKRFHTISTRTQTNKPIKCLNTRLLVSCCSANEHFHTDVRFAHISYSIMYKVVYGLIATLTLQFTFLWLTLILALGSKPYVNINNKVQGGCLSACPGCLSACPVHDWVVSTLYYWLLSVRCTTDCYQYVVLHMCKYSIAGCRIPTMDFQWSLIVFLIHYVKHLIKNMFKCLFIWIRNG